MIKNMFNSLKDKAKQLAPAMLTPEKRFAKAVIATVSLMTMADGQADTSEIEASSNVIFGHKSVKEFLTVDEAKEMYANQIKSLDLLHKQGASAVLLEVNSMIAEIAESVTNNVWRAEIISVAKQIGASNESGSIGSDEKAILDKIESAFT